MHDTSATPSPAPSPAAADAVLQARLPASCDVLVIGAGPAGSACATLLAQHGRQVVLIDQHTFPREKVCGDGLIPDAHAALRRLGVYDAVMAQACGVRQVRCVGPSGHHVDVDGDLAVLPRKVLDEVLVRHAAASGATVCTPWKMDRLIEQDGRVNGATLKHAGQSQDIAARWVVMATGATITPMIGADLCERRTPSGIALRGYVRNPRLAATHTTMDVVWHRELRPGYGWIFPVGQDSFNIGVGAFFRPHSSDKRKGSGQAADANLREMFDNFTRVYPPARDLMDGGELLGGLKGAPLRCTLAGARISRPGLLATGEAIGSTYDFTGEGIGKALETGLLAAEALLRSHQSGAQGALQDSAVQADYRAHVDALRPKFALYERANSINAHPWLADLVIRRAQRSDRLRRRMSGVLNETSNPGNLVSLKGLVRLFLQ